MSVPLTPGQAVWIHGVWNPKRRLCWSDIADNPTLTLKSLTDARVSLGALHTLQPDPVQWISLGKMELNDCLNATSLWGTHPIRHFHADLGDIASAKWTPEQLSRMRVTYQDLLHIGLTPESMRLFTHITLTAWGTLGFTKEHIEKFTEAQAVRLFGIPKQDVMRALQ